jgi:DNA-binding transcriptional regulator of glucitol operon
MSATDEEHEVKPLAHHPVLLVLTLAACCGCLWLGLWQWRRFHESSGTYQNLGYALQWPLFAIFAVYGYLRFFGLIKESRQGHDVSTPHQFSAAMPPRPPAARVEELARSEHPGLVQYNAMLADLARDTEPATRSSR